MKKQTKIWTILSSCLAVIALAIGITCSCLAFSPNSSIEPQIAAGGPTSSANWADKGATSFYRGNGSQSSPFQIRTPAQLAYLIRFSQSNDTSGCFFALTGNVDMKQYYWTPVPEFKGIFDGGGYTISGLYINSEENHKGFFESINQASILNVKIATSDIVVRDAAGVIAANAINSTISHCIIASDVSIQGDSEIGGIVGSAIGCDISFCSNAGSVTAKSGSGAGGIAGRAMESEIRFSYNSGVVSGNETAGGIIGKIADCEKESQGVHDCYNIGNITARSIVGGIAGRADATLITRIYNAGELDGPCVGGIVGRTDRTTITNSFNIGKMPVSEVVGYLTAYGEIIGEGNFTDIKGCVYLQDDENGEARNDIVGVNSSCGITLTTPFPYHQLYGYARTSSFYENGRYWDSSEAWTNVLGSYWDVGASENDGLPVLLPVLQNVIPYKTVYIANNYSPNRAVVYTVLTEPNKKTVTLSSSIFTRNGYTLTKFTETASGSGTSYNNGATLNVTADMTLYAQWSINTYTLTLNPNGGSVSSTSLSYNIESTSTLPTPTRAGFEFLGWKPSSSVGGWYSSSTYAGGTSVNGKYATVTLTAQWKGEKWFGKVSGKNFASSGHAGTASDPYTIDSAGDLAQFALDVYSGTTYSGKVFKQTTNINLGGEEWIPINTSPIGSSDYHPFSGTYDGNNYIISGMYVENKSSGAQFAGLFGFATSATIQNVHIRKSVVICSGATTAYSGSVVATLYGGKISNCSSDAIVKANSGYAGGVVGYVDAGAQVLDCKFSGEVSGTAQYAGGIVGFVMGPSGTTTGCISDSNVESTNTNSYVGGIVGSFGGTNLSLCIFDGIVKGVTVGSIAGVVTGYPTNVKNCAGFGMIYTSDASKAGGIVGSNSGSLIITNCSFIGSSNLNIAMLNSAATCGSSFSQINERKVYSSGDFSEFTVVPNMNDDLPMQNSLFAIAVGGQTSEYVVNHLKGKGFTLVS